MCAMTRDELLLTALLRGDASTVALAQAAGRSERAARYGLTHLVMTGLVWSPERGRWRLTEAGRVIAATISQPPAAPTPRRRPTTPARRRSRRSRASATLRRPSLRGTHGASPGGSGGSARSSWVSSRSCR